MECLSLNHSITLQQLAEKTSTNEEDLAKVLNNYTLQDDTHSNVLPTESEFDSLDVQKKVYFEFIRRALILAHRTNTGITYELSLFGIMLTMAFIRYHYAHIDSIRYPNLVDDHDLDISRSALFYKDITQEEYYDNIAHNYQDKLPLIFAKWDFLKEQLGTTLLYTSFDFMIYKKIPSNSTLQSIWIGGNKEFYEDLKSLADNARYYLLIVYLAGITTLQSLQQYQEIINDSRINPIYRKLAEIEEILKYIDIESFVYQLKGKNRTKSLSSLIKIPNQKSSNMDKVQTIENIFIEELTFLFYLNLNNTVFPPSRSYRTDASGKSNKLDCAMINEVNRLGSPRHCLMAILSKNNDIKQWFSDRISDVTSYRSQTLDKMSKFYNEVINSHQHIRVIPEQQDLTNI